MAGVPEGCREAMVGVPGGYRKSTSGVTGKYRPRADLYEECQKKGWSAGRVPESQEWICRKSARKRGWRTGMVLESEGSSAGMVPENECSTAGRVAESELGVGGGGGVVGKSAGKRSYGVPKVYQTRRVKGWLAEGEDSNAGMVPGSAGRMRFDFRYLKKEMF